MALKWICPAYFYECISISFFMFVPLFITKKNMRIWVILWIVGDLKLIFTKQCIVKSLFISHLLQCSTFLALALLSLSWIRRHSMTLFFGCLLCWWFKNASLAYTLYSSTLSTVSQHRSTTLFFFAWFQDNDKQNYIMSCASNYFTQ